MEGEGFSNRKWNVLSRGALWEQPTRQSLGEQGGRRRSPGGRGAGGGMGFLACRDHSLSVTPGPGSGTAALPGGHTLVPESPHVAEPHRCQYTECVLSLWQLRRAGCGHLGSDHTAEGSRDLPEPSAAAEEAGAAGPMPLDAVVWRPQTCVLTLAGCGPVGRGL